MLNRPNAKMLDDESSIHSVVCRTMLPSLPVCFPYNNVSVIYTVSTTIHLTVFCPSTTNLSSWKNWLIVVCLCTPVRISKNPSHFSIPPAYPLRFPAPWPSSSVLLLDWVLFPVHAPSSSATPSTLSESTPAPPSPSTPYHGSP